MSSSKLIFILFLATMSIYVVEAQDTIAPPTPQAPAPLKSQMLVSTQWLADHLHDPQVVVLHVAKNRADYDRGHLPGARFLADDDFILGHVGLMVELPPAETLKKNFESAGVSDESRVVIYTTDWYPYAARAYYTLDYLGHGDHTALLNGSIEQWRSEGRPISTDSVTPIQENLTLHIRDKVRALLHEAKETSARASGQAILLDSRPQKRDADGHIPGAAHIFWEETVVDAKKPVFRSADELKTLLVSRGITPGHKLVPYCEVGLQASHNYFVAKYLGYDAAMYDGSYYEWNEVEHLPVVKGNALR